MTLLETSLLEWDNFAQNVSNAFQEMRRKEELFDVTLSCSDSDGRTLKGHRALLSASSLFFQKVLCQESAQPKPYIYLKGISFDDLSLVLDFVYNRKVSVPEERLKSFLDVVKEIEINELVQKVEKLLKSPDEDESVFEGEGPTSSQKLCVSSTSELIKPVSKEKEALKRKRKLNIKMRSMLCMRFIKRKRWPKRLRCT